ncbi:MAG: MFS transporter [Burkholderiaceae bacterium]
MPELTSPTLSALTSPDRPPRSFLATLILFAMLGPFAMTSFVPALPAIGETFDIHSGAAQLVLTLSLIGTAFASLAYGKVSDWIGWHHAVLLGLAIACAGSIIAAAGSSIQMVIIGRLIQAIGAGSSFVLIRLIVYDAYGPSRSTAMLGYVTAAMALSPMFAPLIGGLIIDNYHWRWIFGTVAIGSLIILCLTIRFFPAATETRSANQVNEFPGTSWLSLLRHPDFLRFSTVSVSAVATFYAFLSGAPHLLIGTTGVGLTATEYGVYYSLVPLGFLSGSFFAGRWGAQLGNNRLCLLGCSLNLFGAVLAFSLVTVFGISPLAIVGPITIGAIGVGLANTGSQAGLVASSPERPGVASGLCAFGQLMISAVVVQLTGVLVGIGAIVVTLTMVVTAASGLIGYAWWSRESRPGPTSPAPT